MSVMLYPCILCVALLVYLFVLCVACLQFAMCLGVVAILLLDVLCWIDRVWSYKECACCSCDPSVHLSVPSIGFVNVFVCRKLSPHLKV